MKESNFLFAKLILIAIQITILSVNPLYSQKYRSAIKEFSAGLVYINTTKIKTEKISGQVYELWRKKPKVNKFIPVTYSATGSGFLIIDGISEYLVTAAHIAKTTTLNTKVTIKDSLDNPATFLLRDFLKPNENLNWTYHDTADVAALLIEPLRKRSNKFYFKSFSIDIVEEKLEAPIREREVIVLGFPLGLGVKNKFSPISKPAKPSSDLLELVRADTNVSTTFYLLDDPSVNGFSGGPVFEFPTTLIVGTARIHVDAYRLVGLVHGTLSDELSGFAAIVPSFYIYETINAAPKSKDTGLYTIYFPDGKLWSERYYKNGLPWTVKSNLDSNGNPVEMGTLKEGNGSLFIYDLKGILFEIQHYSSGKLIRREKHK